jgi:two-component system sensor histidine kinase and response regulator WspE
VLIFDVEDLAHSLNKLLSSRRLRKLEQEEGENPAQAARKRILVVDDSITVREMERKLLEYQGYEVETAVDGLEGWSALRAMPFDLLISDIDMPRMNGIELIRRLRTHDDTRALPVIVVSYKDSPEHRLQGMEAGANYYLTKSSFEDDSFIQAVEDLIGSAEHSH